MRNQDPEPYYDDGYQRPMKLLTVLYIHVQPIQKKASRQLRRQLSLFSQK